MPMFEKPHATFSGKMALFFFIFFFCKGFSFQIFFQNTFENKNFPPPLFKIQRNSTKIQQKFNEIQRKFNKNQRKNSTKFNKIQQKFNKNSTN